MEEHNLNLMNNGTIRGKVKYDIPQQMQKESACNMHLHNMDFTLFTCLQSW
jgi:hypothetical protein